MASFSSETARLFDIQRYSVGDGPGIRTTVFFKGCSLRCSWCHNPEALSHKIQVMNKEGFDKKVGFDITSYDLMSTLLKDISLYKKSGGGVTFSGGEPMLQAAFIRKTLIGLKEENINTAIDTAGNVPFSSYESILDWVDLFLFDLKILSPQKHHLYTGASNQLILSNLENLLKHRKKVEIRMPIVKGLNDSIDDIDNTISYLSKLLEFGEINRIKVLPYHSLGQFKYAELGFKSPNHEAPDADILAEYEHRISHLFTKNRDKKVELSTIN